MVSTMTRFAGSSALSAALACGGTSAGDTHPFCADSGEYELPDTVSAPEAFIGNSSTTPDGQEIMLDTLEMDMNGDGVADIFDVLAFLDMFSSGTADFNADGMTNAFDVIGFLDAWESAL